MSAISSKKIFQKRKFVVTNNLSTSDRNLKLYTVVHVQHFFLKCIKLNLNGSNIFGTMDICSRYG